MAPTVWLITGCSAGLGQAFAKDLLARNDKVIATARNPETLEGLKELGAHTMALDITAPQAELNEKAKEALKFENRIDALVNNAGHAVIGTLEEMTTEDLQKQYNTNVFGQMAVTRAFLPQMRKRGTGTLVFISSITSYNVVPGCGAYCSSKGALDSMVRTLNAEVKQFGIKVHLVSPGYYRTRIMDPQSIGDVEGSLLAEGTHFDTTNGVPNHVAAYNDTRKAIAVHLRTKTQPGDPILGAKAIFDIIKGEGDAAGKEAPFQFWPGKDAYELTKPELEESLKSLEDWKPILTATDLKEGAQ